MSRKTEDFIRFRTLILYDVQIYPVHNVISNPLSFLFPYSMFCVFQGVTRVCGELESRSKSVNLRPSSSVINS